MNDCERTLAVLNYQSYDRLPVVHFGYWNETLDKWAQEGHITADEAAHWWDGGPTDATIAAKLGFDFNYYTTVGARADLFPHFEPKVLEELPDGSRKVVNGDGVVIDHARSRGNRRDFHRERCTEGDNLRAVQWFLDMGG